MKKIPLGKYHNITYLNVNFTTKNGRNNSAVYSSIAFHIVIDFTLKICVSLFLNLIMGTDGELIFLYWKKYSNFVLTNNLEILCSDYGINLKSFREIFDVYMGSLNCYVIDIRTFRVFSKFDLYLFLFFSFVCFFVSFTIEI